MSQRKRSYLNDSDTEWMDAALARMLSSKYAMQLPRIGGANGNVRSDGFKTTGSVDVAGATNLDTSTAGLLKPTATTTQANANASTGTTGNSITVDRSYVIPNGSVVTAIGLYMTVATTFTLKIVKQNTSTNFDIVVSQAVSHPGTGWVDFTLTTPYAIPGTGTYNLGVYHAGGAGRNQTASVSRSYLLNVDQGVSTNVAFTAADTASVYPMRWVAPSNNMIVRSAQIPLVAVPKDARAAILVSEVDAGVAGTDYSLEVARDDGTDYAAFTLTERFTTQEGYRFVTAEQPALYSKASGSNGRLRFKNLNNKNIQLAGWDVAFHPSA